MGKSTASCFKIISCAGSSHSVDHEDLQTPQSKVASDRHGWSFRKRSARHRALSNNVNSEEPVSASKENPEEKTESPINLESKLSKENTELPTHIVSKLDEKTELSNHLDSKLSEEKTEVSTHLDSELSVEKTELSTHLDSQLSEEKAKLSTHLDSELSVEKSELSTHLDSKLSEETTELSTHLDSELSVEKSELSTHLDSNLSEEKTKLSTPLDSELSVEKSELSTHLDSKLSEEKMEVPTHLDSELSVEKSELSTHLDSNLSEEKTKLSTHLDSKEDEITEDATNDESSIIVIEAAIRDLQAQHVMSKQKNIIKLQAVVRGHIVRRHAVGTLRCIQAIIKMQALVRARYARLPIEGLADPVKQRDRSGQRKKVAQSSDTFTSVSIEKLLSNAFARQLMEATPRTNHINIKCDPLKSDSAWKWLERWVSVSSVSNEETQEFGAPAVHHNKSLDKENNLVPIISKSTGTESGVDASVDESLTSYDMNDLKETDLVEVVQVTQLPKMEDTENNRDLTGLKMPSTQQPEIEVKKISRKASNPAFIAAQSRFKELSLGATAKLSTSSRRDPGVESSLDKVSSSTDQPLSLGATAKLSTSSRHDPGVESSLDKVSSSTDQPLSLGATAKLSTSSHHDPGVESSLDKASSSTDQPLRSKDIGLDENSISTFTLDSPNMSEAGVNGGDMEIKASNDTNDPINKENLELEENSIVLETDPSCATTNKLERDENINFVISESLNSSINMPERDSSRLASPEGSPRSHATVSDFQATPSSQVSVKPKKSKGGKSGSDHKNRRSSADKNLSNHSQDSASRSSLEQHKSGKRRNSPVSAKLDHREQEPRNSSSSNSLPSYMQATKSARAKAIANASPRSSPDVHDKDIYIKKRHSLPGINEMQGSPRMHRSLSQQNASHSPQDRTWRR